MTEASYLDEIKNIQVRLNVQGKFPVVIFRNKVGVFLIDEKGKTFGSSQEGLDIC